MSRYRLRLIEDKLEADCPHVYLPAANRAIYLREGPFRSRLRRADIWSRRERPGSVMRRWLWWRNIKAQRSGAGN